MDSRLDGFCVVLPYMLRLMCAELLLKLVRKACMQVGLLEILANKV